MTQKNKQLLIILLMPILSVLIGFYGVKFYLQSNDLAKVEEETPVETPAEPEELPPVIVDNTTEVETQVEASEVYNFETLKIYAVQAGAFSSESNAKVYKKEMNEKGFGGYVYHTSKYKVYVGAFSNEVIAKEYAMEFNAVVEGAYATAFTLENESFKYPESERTEIETFDALISDYIQVVERLNAVMVNDFSQEYPLEHNDFIDILQTEKEALNEIKSSLDSLEMNYSESASVKGSFNALLEEVVANIQTIESADKKSNYMMTDLLMLTAFEYGNIN